jgi:hypothetical protein
MAVELKTKFFTAMPKPSNDELYSYTPCNWGMTPYDDLLQNVKRGRDWVLPNCDRQQSDPKRTPKEDVLSINYGCVTVSD